MIQCLGRAQPVSMNLSIYHPASKQINMSSQNLCVHIYIYIHSLKLTARAPENRPGPEGISSSTHRFSGDILVSRVGIAALMEAGIYPNILQLRLAGFFGLSQVVFSPEFWSINSMIMTGQPTPTYRIPPRNKALWSGLINRWFTLRRPAIKPLFLEGVC